MKILYISQYFPPEMGAPSARVYETARAWVKSGEDVTVLTGFPNHPTGVVPPFYRGKKFMREQKDGITVIRTMIYPTANKGFIKRILSYLTFMISSIVQGIFSIGKQDVLIASSPQFFVGISGLIISKIKHIPFVFEVRDLWPESIVQLGQLRNKLLINILEKIEMLLYKNAVRIVAVADSTVDILTKRGVDPQKISVIKNGVDLNLFSKKQKPEITKEQYGYSGKQIVSYIGTFGLSHALNITLDVAKILQKDFPNILFLLVGEGAEKENLIKKAKNENITNVVFVDQISKELLPDYYNLSDIVLVTLRKLPLFKHVIPSKIFEIMAMAKPIILAVDGEARELITHAHSGIFCDPENAEALIDAIKQLINDRDSASRLGLNGLKFVKSHFDRTKLAANYRAVLYNITGL